MKCGISAVAAIAAANVAILPASGAERSKPARELRRRPKLDPKLVQQFVGACHRDPDGVKTMLKQEPGLSNASWNLGGGDWERGMEAAAHMGRPDIADTLIQHKARKCAYWAAMAGEEAIVKAFVTSDTEIVNTGGAHGISLMAHAAICGKVTLTQYLRDHGAELDNKSLEHAVRGNRIDMVVWLVENGVNPAARRFDNKLLCDVAEERGYSKISNYLRAIAQSR